MKSKTHAIEAKNASENVGTTNDRLRDLLLGALYELKSVVNNFDDVCETIGITKEERLDLDI